VSRMAEPLAIAGMQWKHCMEYVLCCNSLHSHYLVTKVHVFAEMQLSSANLMAVILASTLCGSIGQLSSSKMFTLLH
jgi:hypothetical protein